MNGKPVAKKSPLSAHVVRVLTGTERENLEKRFWAKVRKTDSCWEWMGCTNTPNGYGYFTFSGRKAVAHRIAWFLCGLGEIPSDLRLDHLCRNPRCVNPKHLEIVTEQTNILRGTGIAALNSKKTHCCQGHEFTEENVVWKYGCRTCRQCQRRFRRESRIRREKP